MHKVSASNVISTKLSKFPYPVTPTSPHLYRLNESILIIQLALCLQPREANTPPAFLPETVHVAGPGPTSQRISHDSSTLSLVEYG